MKKSILSMAIATTLTGIIAAPAQAATLNMDYTGLFTMLQQNDSVISNDSKPYYYDATWNYGNRTQISGTLSFDTATGAGAGTVNGFNFLNAGQAVISGIQLQSIGGGLLLGNMNFAWNGADVTTQIVLNASGFFAQVPGILGGLTTIDQTTCTANPGTCATPASNASLKNGAFPIGEAPIATSSFNTLGQAGFGTTLYNPDGTLALSLGTDDVIGGSPMDNGPFIGININLDITNIAVAPPPIPVPAAVWLFGSGLLGLVGVARRRKQTT